MVNLSNARVRNTLLAALRHWQATVVVPGKDPIEMDLATDAGEQEALSANEIDVLCESLNFGDAIEVDPRCALRVFAKRVVKEPLSDRKVTSIGVLISDALDVVAPESSSAERQARALAIEFRSAAESTKSRAACL